MGLLAKFGATIFLSAFVCVSFAFAEGRPSEKLLNDTKALAVDAKSPYAQEMNRLFVKTWEAAVDLAEHDYDSGASPHATGARPDFAKLKKSPPPLYLLSTPDLVAHFDPNPPTPHIAYSTGMSELLGHQRDAIGGVFAHEITHALQTDFQRSLRMTAEQNADKFSVRIVTRMGLNPRGVESVARVLAPLDKVDANTPLQVVAYRMAIDPHNLPRTRLNSAQEAVRELKDPPPPIDPRNVINPALAKYSHNSDTDAGWKAVWDYVRSVPEGQFFETVAPSKRLYSLLMNVPAMDHEARNFHDGHLQPMFEVFDYLLDHHAKEPVLLEEWSRVFTKAQKGFSDLGAGRSHWATAEMTFETETYRGNAFANSFNRLATPGRGYDSLDYFASLSKIMQHHFRSYLALPEAQAELLRARKGEVSYQEVFHKIRSKYLVDATIQKWRSANRAGNRASQLPFRVLVDEELSYLQREAPHLDRKDYLARVSDLGRTVSHLDSQIWAQSAEGDVFSDPVAFSAAFQNSLDGAGRARLSHMWQDFLKKSPTAGQKTAFLKSLLVAEVPHLIDPVRNSLTTLFNEYGMESFENSLQKTNVELSQFKVRGSLAHGEKQVPLWEEYERVETDVLDPGASWGKKRAALEGFLKKLREKFVYIDDHSILQQLNILQESERLLGDFVDAKPAHSRADAPMVFQAWLDPGVETLRQDGIHPFLANELKQLGIVPPPGLHILSALHGQDLNRMPDYLLQPGDRYRFKTEPYVHTMEQDTKLGIAQIVASSFNLKTAREQLRILEEFAAGRKLEIPSHAETLFDETDHSHLRYARVTYHDGELSGAEFVYPVYETPMSPKHTDELASEMMAAVLDAYGGSPLAKKGPAWQIEINDEIAPEIRRMHLSLPFGPELAAAQTEKDVLNALGRRLVRWKNLKEAKDSEAFWAFVSEHPTRIHDSLFRHTLEKDQQQTLERLRRDFGYDGLTVSEKLERLRRLSNYGNGSIWLDQKILEVLEQATPADLHAFLSKPEGEAFFREQLFHPSARIRAAAHASRGVTGIEAKAQLLAKIVPQPEGYRAAWGIALGDGELAKDRAHFPSHSIRSEDYQTIQAHVPRKDLKQASVAEEFYQRLYHGMDVAIVRFSDRAVSELALHLAHPNLHTLSPETVTEMRHHLGHFLGQVGLKNPVEQELLKLFQALDPDHQRAYLYNIFVRHPTALDSKPFRELLKDTPLFAAEPHDSLNQIKPIVWGNMSWHERAGLTSMILGSDTPMGTLANNDDMIVHNLESLGVPGRKFAQLLQTHGHFIRDSLRAKLSAFRDENVHSSRLEIIAEAEKLFKKDLGLDFWSEVAEVREILGAGSVKVAMHVVLKDGTEVVIKIVDPIVKGRALRNLALTEQSVQEWVRAYPGSKREHGVILYLMRRLRSSVERELDLELETKNTKIHNEKITARGSRYSTPVKIIDRLSSANINTVEFLPHRGNANRTAATAHEHDQIVHEMLSQVLEDGFVHGDLVNRANVLLLKNGQAPAFIDLSLSQPVHKSDVLLMMRFFQLGPQLGEQMKDMKDLLPVAAKLAGTSMPAEAALAELNQAIDHSGTAQLKKLKVPQRQALVEALRENRFLDALELVSSGKAKTLTADVLKILNHVVAEVDASSPVDVRAALNHALADTWAGYQKNGHLELTDLVLQMEKHGLVFKDRYMFLLELMSLGYKEEELAAKARHGAGPSPMKAFAAKITEHVSLADKLALVTNTTAKLIKSCTDAAIAVAP
jgi:predicted unusual protein kinase regulating ubiquinone biosynthesis (AarF/ABC1/UbiB family)